VVGLTEAAREKGGRPSRRATTQAEFLDHCTPAGRRFFQRVLALAQERGHLIYWGTTGFSIRAHLPASDRVASFAYGYPGTLRDTGDDEFHVYFKDLAPVVAEARLAAWRQQLIDYGVFREAGQWTLKAPVVAEEKLALMDQIYDSVLEEVAELMAAA
jgi:hypothetical protein